jgi:lipoprotein-anchoring transpeptidase ErfK/SrfK
MKRRVFLKSAAAGLLAGGVPAVQARAPEQLPQYDMPPEFLPREVRIRNDLAPYEIHVDPGQYALYWTLPDRKAIRYAVGIGRTALYEPGEFFVGAKKEWPSWTPTQEMIERDPASYARWADGMPGGLNNPLGARALYLFTQTRGDTFLRIHGTNAPDTIGRRVSNGCARLINDQMIDLYNRVPLQTRVVLYPLGGG